MEMIWDWQKQRIFEVRLIKIEERRQYYIQDVGTVRRIIQ